MALIAETTRSRRRRNRSRQSDRKSCGPSSAATAAAWLIDEGLPELCDCNRSIAAISQVGPVATPMRNPVIAWLFETPEIVSTR